METLGENEGRWTVSLVLLHGSIGGALSFPFPLLEGSVFHWLGPQSNWWGLFQWLPCLGFLWILLGAIVVCRSSRAYPFVRFGHLFLMCVDCLVAAIGIVLLAFVLFSQSSSRGSYFNDGVFWFGTTCVLSSLVLIVASFVVLFGLRALSTQLSEKPLLERRRLLASLIMGVLGIVYSAGSWGYQAFASDQRQQRVGELYEAQLQSYAYDSGEVKTLVFSPDGMMLATAVKYRVPGQGIRVWDVEMGVLDFDFKYEFDVQALCFTPDGSRLIVGYQEDMNSGGVAVIDLIEGREVLRRSGDPIKHLAVSPGGDFLVICGYKLYGSVGASFSVLELGTLDLLYESRSELGYVEASFSESGDRLAARRRGAMEIWPFPIHEKTEALLSWDPRSSGADITAFSFHSADSKVTVAGTFDAKTFDLLQMARESEVIPSLLPLQGPFTSAMFTKDRECLIVADQQQDIHVVNLGSRTIESSWRSPIWVTGLGASADGDILAIGGHQRILLRDRRSGEVIRELSQGSRREGL